MRQPDSSITFDRAANFYDQTRGFPPGIDRQAAELMVRTAGITRTSTVVEIGVGTGRIALPLAQHSGPYYGVDLSVAMMNGIIVKLPNFPEADIRLTRADVMRLPYRSAFADFAVLVHILHLIPDPTLAVAELGRVLRPGGAAVCGWDRRTVPTLQPISEAWYHATGDAAHIEEPDTGPLTLADAGWTMRQQAMFEYTGATTAHQYVEAYRKRIYSRMWRLSDDTWRDGVDAVEAALETHVPDPHAPQPVEHRFHVAIFAP